jgi:ATP-dependent exoDNAse (exonuclease V) alpha subunit
MTHRYRSDEDIIASAREIYSETGTMPIVLCNTNAEVSKLNGPLRQICNPIGNLTYSDPVNMDYSNKAWRYADWRFGLGDSVINTVNKYTEETKELEVANGEIGIVTKVAGSLVTVRFDRIVQYDLKEDPTIRPAYALTVNKSQGSEYNVVIVKSTSSWGNKKERFYTAVTRAKQKCIIYEVGTANNDCIRAAPAHRKTYLLKH